MIIIRLQQNACIFQLYYGKQKMKYLKSEIGNLRKITYEEYRDNKKPQKADWNMLKTKSEAIKKQWILYKDVPVLKWSLRIFLLAQSTLLAYLYFDIPARRSEYVTVQFTDNGNNNFYDSVTKTFHFRLYKTAKYHGQQLLTVNSMIDDIIQRLKKLYKI
jgi:hypothetical protein